MSNQNEYLTKITAKLEEVDAEIGRLEAKAKSAGADARIERQRYLKELEKRRDEAEKKFKSLQNAGADAFDDLRKGMEGAWKRLEDAAHEARTHFN